jgi:Zn ribbon nucleic-acid-binding protein
MKVTKEFELRKGDMCEGCGEMRFIFVGIEEEEIESVECVRCYRSEMERRWWIRKEEE